MNPGTKNIIMLVTCVVVAVCQTFVLKGFLKKLKRIEHDFWGASAKKAEKDIEKARAEERKEAQEAAEAAAAEQ